MSKYLCRCFFFHLTESQQLFDRLAMLVAAFTHRNTHKRYLLLETFLPETMQHTQDRFVWNQPPRTRIHSLQTSLPVNLKLKAKDVMMNKHAWGEMPDSPVDVRHRRVAAGYWASLSDLMQQHSSLSPSLSVYLHLSLPLSHNVRTIRIIAP